jgi:hypothetical protein
MEGVEQAAIVETIGGRLDDNVAGEVETFLEDPVAGNSGVCGTQLRMGVHREAGIIDVMVAIGNIRGDMGHRG